MTSTLATKCQHFKLRGLLFHYIKGLKKGHFIFKFNKKKYISSPDEFHCLDIMIKFKSQALHIIKIKY